MVRRTTSILISLAMLGVAGFFGCGSYVVALDRKYSSDGEFWAELTVSRSTAVAGGDWYWVTLGRTHPTWRDKLVRNQSVEVCSLEGPGKLSASWASPRKVQVVCARCRSRSFFPVSKEWEGVSIEFVFKDSGE